MQLRMINDCILACSTVVLQRCVDAAKAVFKAIAVAEPRVRGAAKAGLKDALQQRYNLMQEAVMARAAARVNQQLLKAAQQITTVRHCSTFPPSWWQAGVWHVGQVATAVPLHYDSKHCTRQQQLRSCIH